MKRLICLPFLILLVAGNVYAQTDTDAVKTAVNHLFIAMKQADSVALLNSFAPNAVLQTIVKDKQGIVSVRTEALNKFASSIGRLPKDAADEQITFDIVKVDGDLAIVWTPYKFYFKQQFSHCGVNSFQLVRLADGWKIQYLIDTRRKGECL